MIKGMYCHKKQ